MHCHLRRSTVTPGLQLKAVTKSLAMVDKVQWTLLFTAIVLYASLRGAKYIGMVHTHTLHTLFFYFSRSIYRKGMLATSKD